MTSVAKDVLSVFKLRIGVAIALSAVAGLAIAPGAPVAGWKIAALAIGILLSAASAGAFNQFVERDLDAQMPRTRSRPFVDGRFQAGPFWLFTIVGILAAAVAITGYALNAWVALYAFLGAFVYGVVYTVWLKRRSWMNIVIGGLSGSFAVLAGGAAVDPVLSPAVIALAVVLFLWTPPHFWSLAIHRREDYARAGLPMLPVTHGVDFTCLQILLYTVILFIASLLPFLTHMSGLLYLCAAIVLGLGFLGHATAMWACNDRRLPMRTFGYSIYYLAGLFTALLADHYLAV